MQTTYTTRTAVLAKIPDITILNSDVDAVIDIVSGYIDTFLGYKLGSDFATPAQDYFLDGSGTEFLILPQPLNGDVSVQSLSINGNGQEELYIAKYPLNTPHITYIAKKLGVFGAGFGNYVVKNGKIGIFTIDWATPANHTLESNIQAAVTALCVQMIRNAGASVLPIESQNLEYSGAITSETIGSYSATYANDTSKQTSLISSVPTASGILSKYRSINIA